MTRTKFSVYVLKNLKRLKSTKIGGYLYTKVIPPKTIRLRCGKHILYVDGKDEGVTPNLCLKGEFEGHIMKVLKQFIKPGMSVADLGAHIGYMTLIIADLVGETGRVYAFEPDTENFKLLEANCKLNGYNNITLINKAVSNKSGSDWLKVDWLNTGAHSLSQKNVPNFKGDEINVNTVTLDDYFRDKKLDFIKIDVQGWEGRVFQGAVDILKKDVVIVMEFWAEAVENTGVNSVSVLRDLANEYNFNIRIIDNKGNLLNTDEQMIMDSCNKNIVPSFLKEKMTGEINLLLQKKV